MKTAFQAKEDQLIHSLYVQELQRKYAEAKS